IVNSDERQWTWMDEGLNSFLQYLAEQQWERDYPSRRGPASNIVEYMSGDINQIRPIMTNSESVFQLGNNAYGKPATALNILRETVLGRELFDYAFKMYSTRWMFKHPAPADFFRTIEDASGIDLDWFWHGWFFTIDKVDISLDKVSWYKIDSKNPEVELPYQKGLAESKRNISSLRNEKEILKTQDEIDSGLKDFYSTYDPFTITPLSISERDKAMKNMSEAEKSVLSSNKNYYEITFSNKGGLVMPLILLFEYTDGTKEEFRVPAEIWRKDNFTVTKVFPAKGEVKQISLDPYFETADVDLSNNYYPEKPTPSRFELFKSRGLPAFPNPMRSARQQGGN
ncbi:MAG: M1 family peptidase, partial [Bacteroidota bacterium]